MPPYPFPFNHPSFSPPPLPPLPNHLASHQDLYNVPTHLINDLAAIWENIQHLERQLYHGGGLHPVESAEASRELYVLRREYGVLERESMRRRGGGGGSGMRGYGNGNGGPMFGGLAGGFGGFSSSSTEPPPLPPAFGVSRGGFGSGGRGGGIGGGAPPPPSPSTTRASSPNTPHGSNPSNQQPWPPTRPWNGRRGPPSYVRTRSNDREWGRASGGRIGGGETGDGRNADEKEGSSDDNDNDDDDDDDDDDGEQGRNNKQAYAETVTDFSEGSRD